MTLDPLQLQRELDRLLPPGTTSTDPDDLAAFGRDWTRVYTAAPSVVARPHTIDEISKLLAYCHANRVPVVPSGGRTGLAGGAVAKDGELVLSLSRMRKMDPVDVLGQTVRVEAGAVTALVHEHAEQCGLTWPVDFASKGSSQVGGNLSTNAGGVRVIRYGLVRSWVLGLEVVTADGSVLHLNGALEKNNTGVDLRQLFIGSEGTLGVIAAATLKLTRLPGPPTVFLFGVPDLAAVLQLFREVRAHGPFVISAYEFFTEACLQRVLRHRPVTLPLASRPSHYVLLEVEAHEGSDLEPWLTSLFDRGLVTDGTMAQTSSQAAQLWALREGISESLSATGLPHKNDIALPIAALEAFSADFEALMTSRYPAFEVCVFGHIGDGNLHVNVMKPDAMDKTEFFAETSRADHAMFELVRRHRGSISAEHGIGLLKRPYLSYSRSEAELATMRAIKQALDPHGILNPGKILG